VHIVDDGEVPVRGSSMMRGCFDGDGWLHTGVLGVHTGLGGLRIFDRTKVVFPDELPLNATGKVMKEQLR
jgi:long-subunit acyl-CoA synthetase (AMP-forming)